MGAVTQVVCEHGAAGATVARIVARAGVSRRTFYVEFASGEEAVLAALEQALAYTCARVAPAFAAPASWRERIRAGLAELLLLFDAQPQLARLLVVESLSAGPRAMRRRAEVLAALTEIVHAGREHGGVHRDVPRLTAEGVVGAVLSVLHSRLAAETAGEDRLKLSALFAQLMATIVLPYHGAAQARRELDRPAPVQVLAAGESDAPLRADPFKAAGMRLTYRTMRVLGTVAEHPGASNRRIGEAAGVSDQGQMSKLLARLQRLGLIANGGSVHVQGEPNSWTLTAAGRQMQQSIYAQAVEMRGERKGRE